MLRFGLWFLLSGITHFAHEDPDDPESACHDRHDDVEQEASDSILLLAGHVVLLVSRSITIVVFHAKRKTLGVVLRFGS